MEWTTKALASYARTSAKQHGGKLLEWNLRFVVGDDDLRQFASGDLRGLAKTPVADANASGAKLKLIDFKFKTERIKDPEGLGLTVIVTAWDKETGALKTIAQNLGRDPAVEGMFYDRDSAVAKPFDAALATSPGSQR